MRLPFRLIAGVLAASLLSQVAACGTLFYPDRRGQIDGKIDPAVAAMNAIGILFFVIPGLIAFAIDFTTGAIYLPDGKYALAPEQLQNAIGADGKVDNAKLKAIIERATGHSLPLEHPNLRQQRGDLQQLASLGLQPAG
jgi:hypothetical protein